MNPLKKKHEMEKVGFFELKIGRGCLIAFLLFQIVAVSVVMLVKWLFG